MRRNHTILTVMVLVSLLLASACNQTVAEDAPSGENQTGPIDTPANPAATATLSNDYWDGGDYPERPVYSLIFGISQTAHDTFSACGLPERNIEHAVEVYLQQGPARQAIIAQDSEQETLWSVAIEVIPLTADIYEVTCSKIEP